MGQFADQLHAGIDEAARKMSEARLAGDNYGAEAYRERLGFLHRVAKRHGLGPWPEPETHRPADEARDEDAAAMAGDSGLVPRTAG